MTMVDVPVYYHEEARVTNGVLVLPGVNWDASRNVLSVPIRPLSRAEAAEANREASRIAAPKIDGYVRETVHQRAAVAIEPAQGPAPASKPLALAAATAPHTAGGATSHVAPVQVTVAASDTAAAGASTPPTTSRLPIAQFQPALPAVAFTMRKSDQNVQRMLERWGADAGWKVVWQSGPVIPIDGDATVGIGDFLKAADMVIKQAQAAGYRVKATAFSNNVLQVGGSE